MDTEGMGKIYSSAIITPRTKLFCHPNTSIGDGTFISCAELHMAEGACINRNCEIQGRGKVFIGRYAQICSFASLITSTDTPEGSMCDLAPAKLRRIKTGDINIGDHAAIGSYSMIFPGITIGEKAVIGAQCKITHDIAPNVIVRHFMEEPTARLLDVDLTNI